MNRALWKLKREAHGNVTRVVAEIHGQARSIISGAKDAGGDDDGVERTDVGLDLFAPRDAHINVITPVDLRRIAYELKAIRILFGERQGAYAIEGGKKIVSSADEYRA